MKTKKKKNQIPLHHVTGWYGSIAIVGAYFLSSFGILHNDQVAYQLINLSGAAGIFYLAFKKDVKESMFLNGFWFVIATVSIVKLVIQ